MGVAGGWTQRHYDSVGDKGNGGKIGVQGCGGRAYKV